jgi:hypothetical protein
LPNGFSAAEPINILVINMSDKTEQAPRKDFELLGVTPDASPKTIQLAYKALVKTWHPDRFPEGSLKQQWAEEKLKEINVAYSRIRRFWAADQPAEPRGHPATSQTEPERSADPSNAYAEEHPHGFGGSRSFAPQPWHFATSSVQRFLAGQLKTRKALRYMAWLSLALALFAIWVGPNSITRHSSHGEGPLPPRQLLPGSPKKETATRLPEKADPGPPGKAPRPEQVDSNGVAPSRDMAPDRSFPPAKDQPFFTLGSSKQEVLRVQGKPQRISGQTWIYGFSEVGFKDDRVWRYNNFDRSLKVSIIPTTYPGTRHLPLVFTLGASKDEVLWVQGIPTRVEGNKWYYGLSEVMFQDRHVIGFNNFFNDLQIRMEPTGNISETVAKSSFTIGSSQDEVLAVQGTPTSVQVNVWSYQLSEVTFQDGKVRYVNNFSGNLRFFPADLAAED